ncbi:nuclear receptor coactivator 5 [Euwallacea fornicatus]|uniref:nuclear receptor coactivator 5 n=1 Tax=Euwallacea fornicatus TaxID=995702 RepID=UPI00338F1F8D
MYRTDKQFMKNPATAASRIYIGGIPKAIIADDLEAKFSKHGKLLGLSINTGFAFIQYDSEQEAQNAIKGENGTVMMGRKIIVRQAFAPSGPMVKNFTPQQKPEEAPPSQRTPQFESPLEKEKIEGQEEVEPGPNIRPPPQKFDNRRGGARMGGPMGRPRGPMFEPPHADSFSERGRSATYFEEYGPPQGDITSVPDRNDCEIIVVSRALTEYAEFIESRLKHLGLIVDLLFPNEDVPIGKVLANISSRGCLYAILVMPQNEEHRSLTLNILHGIPQEHRNMPLDDAMILIQRNFESYMRGEKAPEDPVKMSLADRHPVPIQMIFNLLAENRMLTTSQYDRIIKYLQDRRDLQQENEVSEGISQDVSEGSKDKQSELQNRILSILNKSNELVIPASITALEPATQEAPPPLLKDPSVQKALDSILMGDMFKELTGGV